MIEHPNNESKRFWSKVNKTEDCWLWTAATKSEADDRAYGVFWNGKRLVGAHRYAYEILRRPLQQGEIVMHLCDVPRCVNPNHLLAGSQSENILQAFAKGRMVANRCFGSRHPNSKLVESDIDQIKQMAADGQKHQDIAKLYGVAYPLITRIVNGKSWRHTCRN